MTSEEKYKEIASELESEKKTKHQLQAELEMLRLHISELESTNNHLVAATWRERDLKKKLSDTLNELSKTKEIVENQNKRITESINYARKIQLAINPSESDLRHFFPDSFIHYVPKDVISGDFPWVFHKDGYLYIAAVDCTGHGVPGAMLSMIGNLLLNDIVNDYVVKMPSTILNELHNAVVKTLKQNTNPGNSNDGMDIGLCRIHKEKKEIVYSGAHRPMFYLKEREITSFGGDKFPIGGMHYKGKNEFTDQVINFEENEAIFLFTDGFPDQIGGEEKKKLMSKNLKCFLEVNNELKMENLRDRLSSFFQDWKGQNKQVDDVLMMGIRF